jgi:hypothetical protein
VVDPALVSEKAMETETSRNPGAPGCPRIEPIAALLDRQLRGRDRQDLLDHLAECETCYGVFAATSQVLSTEIPAAAARRRGRGAGGRILRVLLILGAALALWQAIRLLRRPVVQSAADLAQSLGAAGRAVPIATSAVESAGIAPGVAFGRAELHLAVAQLENRPAEAIAAARTLARLAGLSAGAGEPEPRGLAVRDAYSRIADDLESGRSAATAPPDGATLFPPRDVGGGRCLEAAEHAAGGGAWFAGEAARRCRAAVARLRLAGVERVLAAWPEDGTPDALALASALAALGAAGADDNGTGPR